MMNIWKQFINSWIRREQMENEENVNTKNLETKQLILIPKIEDYIEYIVNIIFKLPRTEKFSIGYETLERALYIEKINKRDNKKKF